MSPDRRLTARRRRSAGVLTPLVAGGMACLVAGCAGDDPTAPGPPAPLEDVPPDLAAVTFEVEGEPTAPSVMLELREPDGFRGFVAVNGRGEPLWFHRTTGSPFSFARRHGGNFVLLDSERGLSEVTTDGRVVRMVEQQEAPDRRIHHDVAVTARNTVLFIAEDWQTWRDTLLAGEAIWEWDPEAGTVEQRWSAFDHLDPAVDWGPRSQRDDWLHANSLSVGFRGNLLLSLHFLDQVLSIAPDFDRIEWRLGGTGASIPVDDPFSGQHTAAEVAAGRVLLFDNGFARTDERFSRAVEYERAGGVARNVWEWRPERANWARVISGARRLPNGNTLVGFGTPEDASLGSTGPIEVYEVTRDGAVVWHLVVGGAVASMYRATPLLRF